MDIDEVDLRLDLQFFAGEKTEKATPKKRQDSRKKGQVAKSQDVNTAIVFDCCFCSFFIYWSYIMKNYWLYYISSRYYVDKFTEDNVHHYYVECT